MINTTDKTTEIPFNFTVNTNNRTGYTATLSSETENTALTNATSTTGAKIGSISTNLSLNNLPNNTWGYKFGASSNYAPIPALSTPAQILQTTGKTNGNEMNNIKIGMKLADNLESGNYQNKLILSFVSNPYTMRAIMTNGRYFNYKLKALETATNKIEHFKKSTVVPIASVDAVNIEDEDSDYEIKLWLDPIDKAAYYYTEPEKVYLNEDSNSMFFRFTSDEDMKNILDIDLSGFDTSKVTNMSLMFHGMSNLTTLNLPNFDTSKVTDMSSIFSDMSNLATLNLSNFNTSKVMRMDDMFSGMSNLTSLNLSNFNTSKVMRMDGMFYGTSSLTTLNLSNFDTSNVTNMAGMFSDMSNLTTLNLSNFDTSKVTNMAVMFSKMSSLTSLDLSNFDTSKVWNMRYMFSFMSSLTSLNLSNFNTSNVTDMKFMFSGMRNLISLNLSSFDTSKVTDMSYMFRDMSNLTTLNLSNFNTSKVTNMMLMFSGMRNLISLNLSNFNTSNVTDMGAMFSDMSNLSSLDISNFNTSQVTDMGHMFGISNIADLSRDRLEKIYVNNDFDTSKLTSYTSMFIGRKKLRGGNGSYLSDPSTADKTWLRVDRPGVQGYFTRKP